MAWGIIKFKKAKMGQTIAEKILSSHAKRKLKAGDLAICQVDFCFSQDGTSGLVIDNLLSLKAKKIFNQNKFCMVIDHSCPSPNLGVSKVHKKIREYGKKFKVKVYDVGFGVCHQILPEEGLVVPGDLVVGADSHTCTYGAINVFSTGFGSTDLAMVAACGKNWFKVPQTQKIILRGKLPKGVYSKDIILYLIGKLGADGCTYQSVEFTGEVIRDLSVDARFTISNMAVELGAKCGLMETDAKTIAWVKKHSHRKFKPVFADKDAHYVQIKEIDVSKLEPQVAKPHTVDNVCGISKVIGTPIQEAYLGTCTNGRLEDLEIAANILKNKKVNPGVRFIVAPASRKIYLAAIKKGIIDILVNSGASIITPGCGPCVGTHAGVPADGEVVISTANRNFKGRMGNPKAFIYLASPAAVCASAITGKIADPRKHLK